MKKKNNFIFYKLILPKYKENHMTSIASLFISLTILVSLSTLFAEDRVGNGNPDPLSYTLVSVKKNANDQDGMAVLNISKSPEEHRLDVLQQIKKARTQIKDLDIKEKDYELPAEDFYKFYRKGDEEAFVFAENVFIKILEKFGDKLQEIRKTGAKGLGMLLIQTTMPYEGKLKKKIDKKFENMALDLQSTMAYNYLTLGEILNSDGKDKMFETSIKKCKSVRCIEELLNISTEWQHMILEFSKVDLSYEQMIGKNAKNFSWRFDSPLLHRAFASWVLSLYDQSKEIKVQIENLMKSPYLSDSQLTYNITQFVSTGLGEKLFKDKVTFQDLYNLSISKDKDYVSYGRYTKRLSDDLMYEFRTAGLATAGIFTGIADGAMFFPRLFKNLKTKNKNYLEISVNKYIDEINNSAAGLILEYSEEEFNNLN